MATVTIVFKCSLISESPDESLPGSTVHTIELVPDAADPKNQAVFPYLPLGNIRLQSIKGEQAVKFTPGGKYQVDIKGV